jgi:hypothetical protein
VYIQRAEEERNRIVATQFGASAFCMLAPSLSGVFLAFLTRRIALLRRR